MSKNPQYNPRLSIFNKLKDIDLAKVESLAENDNKLRGPEGWEKVIWSACGIR